jgi:hypothetical protein
LTQKEYSENMTIKNKTTEIKEQGSKDNNIKTSNLYETKNQEIKNNLSIQGLEKKEKDNNIEL